METLAHSGSALRSAGSGIEIGWVLLLGVMARKFPDGARGIASSRSRGSRGRGSSSLKPKVGGIGGQHPVSGTL